MVKFIIGIIVALALLVGVGWIGLNIYSCVVVPTTGQSDIPEVAEASHSVHIKNTGNLLLATDYEIIGDEVGSRVIILHGFWEMRGQSFEYKPEDIVLDESIFGIITVKRR